MAVPFPSLRDALAVATDPLAMQSIWDRLRQENIQLAQRQAALGMTPSHAYTWYRPTTMGREIMPRDYAVMAGATEAARPPASLSPLAAVPRLPAPAPQQQAPPPPDVSRFTDPEAMDPVAADLLNQGRLPDAAALAISVWNANPNDPRARAILEKVASAAGTSDMGELAKIAEQPYSYDFGEGERLLRQPWAKDFVESHRLAAQLRALGQEVPFMPGLRPAVAANPPQTRKETLRQAAERAAKREKELAVRRQRVTAAARGMTLPQLALEEKVAAGQQPSLRDLLMAYPDFAPAFATIQAARAQAGAQRAAIQREQFNNEITALQNYLTLMQNKAEQGQELTPEEQENVSRATARLNQLLGIAGAPSGQPLSPLPPEIKGQLQEQFTPFLAQKVEEYLQSTFEGDEGPTPGEFEEALRSMGLPDNWIPKLSPYARLSEGGLFGVWREHVRPQSSSAGPSYSVESWQKGTTASDTPLTSPYWGP